jgi:uncharacterized membrane protein YqiK
MDLVTMGVISGVVVVGGVVFYLKSIKYFTPSEVVVIPIPPVTIPDEFDEKGNPLRTSYRIIRDGGYVFLPFWEKYYVLPVNRIKSKVSSKNILTKDELRINVDIIIQYKINTETPLGIDKAFKEHSDLIKDTNATNRSKKIADEYESLIQGVIFELVTSIEIKELIQGRIEANKKLTKLVQDAFDKYGLIVDSAKIIDITIENQEYFASLEERVATIEKIKLLKVRKDMEDAEADYEKRQIVRQTEVNQVQYDQDKKQLQLDNDLEIDKITANEKMAQHQEKVEEYNRNSILVKERAKKDAELILAGLNLSIAEIDNQAENLMIRTETDRIKAINEAMSKTNGFASLLIMLERNPDLLKQLFGKNGLSKLANSVTQHLANIESVNIMDVGGSEGSKGSGIGSFERFGLMIPTLLSQSVAKLNKIGLAQTLTDIGVDKEAIKNIKKNKKLVEELLNRKDDIVSLLQKVGIKNSDNIIINDVVDLIKPDEDEINNDANQEENSKSDENKKSNFIDNLINIFKKATFSKKNEDNKTDSNENPKG